MERSLEIIVILIVILITAVVILFIFNKGTEEWMGVFHSWSRGSADKMRCEQACLSWCGANKGQSEIDWGAVEANIEFQGDERCEKLTGRAACTCGISIPGT